MSFYNKIQVTFLNFAQKVVTITTGSDIGINNILQVIEANFEDTRRMFDPKVAGGGITFENIVNNTITSDKVNLQCYKYTSFGSTYNSVLANGQGNFAPYITIINGTFQITGTFNKALFFSVFSKIIVTNSAGNALNNIQLLLQISTDSSFTSLINTRLVTEKVLDNGNGVWTNQNLYINEVFYLPKGFYYVRVQTGADGNSPMTLRTEDNALSIMQF